MLSNFDFALTKACFGLLGLWWAVVQFKDGKDHWLEDPTRRRMAYDVSLYFLLPGLMSLFSLLSEEVSWLWRAGFGIAAVLGIMATLFASIAFRSGPQHAWWVRPASAFACTLYVVIAVLSFDPGLVQTVAPAVRPLLVEAILATMLVFLGVNFAWFVFTEPTRGFTTRHH